MTPTAMYATTWSANHSSNSSPAFDNITNESLTDLIFYQAELVPAAASVLFNTLALIFLSVNKTLPCLGGRIAFAKSLAAADLLVSSTAIFTHFGLYLIPYSPKVTQTLMICVILILVSQSIAFTAHVWTMLALILDKFFAIIWHPRYVDVLPSPKIWIVNAVVWVWSITVALVYQLTSIIANIPWAPQLGTGINTLPYVIIYVVYFATYMISKRAQSRVSRPETSDFHMIDNQVSAETRGLIQTHQEIRMYALVCFLQLIGILAMFSFETHELMACGDKCYPDVSPADLLTRSFVMVVIQVAAAVDPWIHTLRYRDTWVSMWKKTCKRCCAG